MSKDLLGTNQFAKKESYVSCDAHNIVASWTLWRAIQHVSSALNSSTFSHMKKQLSMNLMHYNNHILLRKIFCLDWRELCLNYAFRNGFEWTPYKQEKKGGKIAERQAMNIKKEEQPLLCANEIIYAYTCILLAWK